MLDGALRLYDVRDGPDTDWTADLTGLRARSVPTASWRMQGSPMHLRSVLVDDEHAVVGSVGWTPQSVFLTEELSLHVRSERVAGRLTDGFESWWTAAVGGENERSSGAGLRLSKGPR